tara:strand:+ start:176 stop:328 length:153 start_codon:yes stop_codon:yes gene_type:complete
VKHEKAYDQHAYKEAWKSLQQQMLLLLDPEPNKVIRLTLDCSDLQESKES